MDEPTLTQMLTGFTEKFEQEAKEATKPLKASPYPLVQLDWIRKMLRAYNKTRELLILERLNKQVNKRMTIEQKHELEAQVIAAVEEELQKETSL
ncbi:MAG: hypothetical protein ACREBJ_03770 [Nitrosotalea sp.]